MYAILLSSRPRSSGSRAMSSIHALPSSCHTTPNRGCSHHACSHHRHHSHMFIQHSRKPHLPPKSAPHTQHSPPYTMHTPDSRSSIVPRCHFARGLLDRTFYWRPHPRTLNPPPRHPPSPEVEAAHCAPLAAPAPSASRTPPSPRCRRSASRPIQHTRLSTSCHP